jgi:hypothetical protein
MEYHHRLHLDSSQFLFLLFHMGDAYIWFHATSAVTPLGPEYHSPAYPERILSDCSTMPVESSLTAKRVKRA